MDNLWITGNQYLVGGSTPLKNMKVNWDYDSQYMEKHVPNHEPDNLYESQLVLTTQCGAPKFQLDICKVV